MVKKHVSNKPDEVQAALPEGQEGVPFVLKATVIGLGVLMIAGLAVVLSTIIYRSVKSDNGPAALKPGQKVDVSRLVDLKIDPQSVKSVSLSGNRVAIQTQNEIIIVDYRRGQVMGRIKLKGGK